MKTIACYKVSPDNQDISVLPDRSISFDRAQNVLGEYDLVAIEEAVRLAEQTGGACTLLSVGDSKLEDSKLVKGALSRGAEDLICVVDDGLSDADPFQTASVIASVLRDLEFDLVVFGEGSSDLYAQQTGSLVGALLGLPTMNAVSEVTPGEGSITVKRTLEQDVETLELTTPAVISVKTDINLPRVPKMKDILSAGKKPVEKRDLADVGGLPATSVKPQKTLAPQDTERKNVIFPDASPESIQELAAAIRAAQ